ncbi:MAG: two-component sensor histidine kinase, partial [Bdellovibrio sp.]
MKVKLIAVLVAMTAVFIGAVLWRTDNFVYSDRMSWVEAQTRAQVGAINRSLATELKSLQRVIATFNADNFKKGQINWNSLAPYYAVASFTLNGADLEPQTLLVKENSKASAWSNDFVKAAIGPLAGRSADLRFYVKPFQDSQRGRYVALLFIEKNKAYALFGSGEIFQSLIDSQRGSLSSFSIVSSAGLTVGHSVPEYLGTVMRDDPVFREAQQSGSSHGSRVHTLKSGELFGMYELVPQSNLMVLSSAPLTETMKGRSGLWWQLLLWGCGIIAVGVAVILRFITAMEEAEAEFVPIVPQAALPLTPTPAPAQTTMPDLEVSSRVASA